MHAYRIRLNLYIWSSIHGEVKERLNMFATLFKPRVHDATPQQLYGAVMAQSREPWFFATLNVPDTVMGRFDMLALHVYLLARRLAVEKSEAASALSQDIFDLFVADLDRALRELGIGDTSVPKKKKKMVRSFYGQIEDFDECLDGQNAELLEERVLSRYFAGTSNGDAPKLTEYMTKCVNTLKTRKFAELASGKKIWPKVPG